MNVREKFILKISIVILVAIGMSVVVFFIGTSDFLESESPTSSPIGSIPIDSDRILGIPSSVTPESDGSIDASANPQEVATITLADAKDPTVTLAEDPVTSPQQEQNTTAEYTVRYRASWSRQLHPDWYPSGAHVSPMVAWSHGQKDIGFKVGTIASDGMEIMAESGGTSVLREELDTLARVGYVFHSAFGSVFDAPGEDTVTLRLAEDASLVTVVSMLAPSPDWFVTAQNVSLFEDGRWVNRKEVVAKLYDAGTDSGATFTARDQDTSPAEPITLFPEAPRLPIASFEFIRLP